MSTEACLEAGQRGHPFFHVFLVSDPRPVAPGDVFADRLRERLEAPVFGLAAAIHLVLHRPEKRFHDAVVEAIPLPRHRLEDPSPLPRFDVPAMLVLPSLVGMEHEALEVVPEGERGAEHPLGLRKARAEAQVIRGDPAVVHVLDGAQAAFPPRERELAHVGRPLLVRPRAREVGFVMDLAVLPHVFRDDQVVRDLPDIPPDRSCNGRFSSSRKGRPFPSASALSCG